MPTDAPATITVVCGDFGSESCGVGASEAAFAAHLAASGHHVEVVDPLDRWRRVARAMWQARRRGGTVLVVFPTRSTATSAHALVSLGMAMALIRRSRRVVHLHEYAIFHEVRWAWDLLLVARGTDVVVSRSSDAAALGRAWRGLVARRAAVNVIPAVNGTAPPAGWMPPARRHPPVTVGVFGRWSADRGDGPPLAVLRALPASVERLELVGEGWDTFAWPDDVRDRYTIVPLGRLATADLPRVFGGWDVAVTPLVRAAHDGRMSLRTPLAFGVPTITSVDDPADLTLRPPHLLVVDDGPVVDDRLVVDPSGRHFDVADEAGQQGAAEVARFEAAAAARIAALLGGRGR